MMTETSITVTPSEGAPHAPQVKSDPGQGQGGLGWLRLNTDYFKTIPGILKLIQVLFGIICMACASPARLSGTNWFLFVVVSSFISTLIWISVYLLSIKESLKLPIDWTLTELMNTVIKTILYAIAFIVQLSVWSPGYLFYRDSNLTAGAFGLFNTLAYAAGAYYLYAEWKYSQGSGVGP
ncbi:UNVERIFIED_CONTAM: hypothetical protein PYX00_005369 [Menopon gallinae]|uniref:MARVEL domain-containing protein n=1 Tax=Menopon gallinae TaxID=328185 RepID=A0AAW2HSD6_9NEOP